MKIDAKVRWLIDDSALGIAVDDVESVAVDLDYVESEADVYTEVVDKLRDNYNGMVFDEDEFIVENLNDIMSNM